VCATAAGRILAEREHAYRRVRTVHMSARSTADKLLIKPASTVWVSDTTRIGLVGPLPEGVGTADRLGGADVAIVFADDEAKLRGILARSGSELDQPRAVWVAYPKANRTDLNRDSLWPILAGFGMRPITQIAIDDVWSALRFRPLAEGEQPFTGPRSSR
jgi:hypothetical protein